MNVWTFIFYSSWPFLEIDDEKLYKSRIERRLVASCGLDAFGWKENHKKWLFVCYCPATLLFSWSRKWQYNHEECSSFTISMKPFTLMRTSFALLVLCFLLIRQTFQFDKKTSNFYFAWKFYNTVTRKCRLWLSKTLYFITLNYHLRSLPIIINSNRKKLFLLLGLNT